MRYKIDISKKYSGLLNFLIMYYSDQLVTGLMNIILP